MRIGKCKYAEKCVCRWQTSLILSNWFSSDSSYILHFLCVLRLFTLIVYLTRCSTISHVVLSIADFSFSISFIPSFGTSNTTYLTYNEQQCCDLQRSQCDKQNIDDLWTLRVIIDCRRKIKMSDMKKADVTVASGYFWQFNDGPAVVRSCWGLDLHGCDTGSLCHLRTPGLAPQGRGGGRGDKGLIVSPLPPTRTFPTRISLKKLRPAGNENNKF